MSVGHRLDAVIANNRYETKYWVLKNKWVVCHQKGLDLSCLTQLYVNISKWKMKLGSIISCLSFNLKPIFLHSIAKTLDLALLFQYLWNEMGNSLAMDIKKVILRNCQLFYFILWLRIATGPPTTTNNHSLFQLIDCISPNYTWDFLLMSNWKGKQASSSKFSQEL